MKHIKNLILVLMLIIISVSFVYAADSSGIVKMKVGLTANPLLGATVNIINVSQIIGTDYNYSNSLVTLVDGVYTFTGLNTMTAYKITVLYPGFSDKSNTVISIMGENMLWNPLFICSDVDLDGFYELSCGGTDCNDKDDSINPSATEVCDGVDNNCINGVDEGCSGLSSQGSSGGGGSNSHPEVITSTPIITEPIVEDQALQTEDTNAPGITGATVTNTGSGNLYIAG
ncbi:MAG: putative metal-binding motif-containing protein, partial [Nanoarchaeota archaeon]|nr:putative metal-binding motif-containing protein [Nanoarchaeota archaeon]